LSVSPSQTVRDLRSCYRHLLVGVGVVPPVACLAVPKRRLRVANPGDPPWVDAFADTHRLVGSLTGWKCSSGLPMIARWRHPRQQHCEAAKARAASARVTAARHQSPGFPIHHPGANMPANQTTKPLANGKAPAGRDTPPAMAWGERAPEPRQRCQPTTGVSTLSQIRFLSASCIHKPPSEQSTTGPSVPTGAGSPVPSRAIS